MSLQDQQTSREGPSPGLSLNTPKLLIRFPEQGVGKDPQKCSLDRNPVSWSFGENSKLWRGTNLQKIFTGVMSLVADEAGNNYLGNNGSVLILTAQSPVPGRIQGHLHTGFSPGERHVARALKSPIDLGQEGRRPLRALVPVEQEITTPN